MRRPGPITVRVAALVLAVAGLLTAVVAPAAAAPHPAQAQSPAPKAYVVVNATTGEVLDGGNAHEPLRSASLAKIMTALTAVERLPADATIPVSELAAAQPASRIGLVAGQEWRFEDAMATLMMTSANDSAYAIAEAAGGSLDGFAAAMQRTGERLGMQDSTFADPAGFDDAASFGGGPRMSAFDVAIATRNALAVPAIAHWAARREHQFVDPAGATRTLTNHNKMIPGNSRAYAGATGFKTGYTKAAGHTFVATAERDGCSLIVVIIDTYDTYGWAGSLLDTGFANGCRPGSSASGTSERLPEVAIRPYAARQQERQAFVALARGAGATAPDDPTGLGAGGDDPVGAPDRSGVDETVTGPLADAAPIAAPGAGDETGDTAASGGVLTVRNAGLGGLVLLVVLVMLRRRAVKRRRARRLAYRRARAARMRSGALPVVDGRYRPGSRMGPPLDSHVRVHRVREDRA